MRFAGDRLDEDDSPVTDRHSLRRGVLTAWSIFGLLLSGFCTALVFNHLWVSAVRNESQHCAEAAALAAAHGLLSDDMLRLQQQPVEQEWRIARSRQAAVDMSAIYARSRPIQPFTEANVQCGLSSEQSSSGLALPDHISVGYDRNTPQSRIPFMLSGITGIRDAAVGIRASVRLEHHPTGFQPLEAVAIPMMPFCIPDDSGQTAELSWTRMIEHGLGQDDFAWSAERRTFDNGPDGLPEITLNLNAQPSAAGDCDRLLPIQLCHQPFDNNNFIRQMQLGVSLADLQSAGISQVRFPQSVVLSEIPADQFHAVVETLSSLRGQAVIWCLSEPMFADDQSTESSSADSSGTLTATTRQDASLSTTAAQLLRPVAARIIRIHQIDTNQATITLQPCVLTTSTAIMNSVQPHMVNRYIYSVRLVH